MLEKLKHVKFFFSYKIDKIYKSLVIQPSLTSPQKFRHSLNHHLSHVAAISDLISATSPITLAVNFSLQSRFLRCITHFTTTFLTSPSYQNLTTVSLTLSDSHLRGIFDEVNSEESSVR